ncbi:OmpA family protein [Desulfovibrio sp. JC010]|uniref:OmpA family protein n=1 Tax=Desulfovibrio sp. JC010 TaxID=2593641 RepID=UPI0013D6417A|nr:OmpA family protein [Desulfovibrio sp. JC010]NDV26133.1 OmpA family protein [Desulfovibrio sp. JC010]
MKKLVFLIIFIFSCVPFAYAGQDGFAANSDDILRMITDPGGRAFLKIEFKVNSSKISKKTYPVVNSLGDALTSGPGSSMQVRLVGHTDSAGDSAYNKTLSLKRAEAVKNYLAVHFNIDPDRIEIAGMGEEQPIASNESKKGRARNRRVEVVNISKKADAPKILKELDPNNLEPKPLDTKNLW